ALAEALRRRGLEPVPCAVVSEAPAPEPEPLERMARTIERYQWLVVASGRAVMAVMEARNQAPLPAGLRPAAVGERTAERLVAAGAAAPLTANVAGAAALIDALEHAASWRGVRVLVPRALEGGREIGEALRRWGALIDEVAAYSTTPRPAD